MTCPKPTDPMLLLCRESLLGKWLGKGFPKDKGTRRDSRSSVGLKNEKGFSFQPWCGLLGALLLFASLLPSYALRMEPPLAGDWNSFPIVKEGRAVCVLRFDFTPTEPASATKTIPPGLIHPIQAPGDSFLSCSWQIAEPDRDDRFSVRWKGAWQPGKITCEIRLRADDEASFFLDGSRVLTCQGAVAGVTRTFQLDARRHDLRLDYSEREGDAFVHLDWREPGRAWRNLVTEVPKKKDEMGWQATYFLGENFEKIAFSRTDPVIDYDWNEEGPFDRPEDLPTAKLDWANPKEKSLLGQIRSNRDGVLSLTLSKGDCVGDSTNQVEVQSTHLVFGEIDRGSETLDLHFDRAASENLVLESTEDSTGSATGVLALMRFPLKAGKPLRFWESRSGVRNGAGVAKKLKRALDGFKRSRPSLTDALSAWDRSTFVAGRFWCRSLTTLLELGIPIPPLRDTERGLGGEVLERNRYIRPVAADLPQAVSSMTSLWARDLFSSFQPQLDSLPQGWASAAFVDASTPELDRLGRALSLWKKTFESNRNGSDKAPPVIREAKSHLQENSELRWPVRSLAEGLADAIVGLAVANGFVFPNPSGGIDLGNSGVPEGEFGIEKVKIGEKTYSVSASARGLNLRCDDGFSLRSNLPALFSGFHINEKNEWSADVVMKERGSLEVGPPKRIRGATWNRTPLLLTHRGQSLFSGRLPTERGSLTVAPAEERVVIPLE